ncbi:MAG: hypothetical protein ABI921_09835, partial [Panacibacter sp.]
ILTTNVPGCSFTASASSNYEVVTVRAIPEITFLPPEISILSGESATLNATVTGATASFAWKPDALLLTPQALISSTVPLSNDTTFYLTVVDVNGCTSSNEMIVKVLYQMHVPSAFTPNKDGKNDVFRIPPGFLGYFAGAVYI